DAVHLHLLDPAHGEAEMPSELDGAALRWADGSAAEVVTEGEARIVSVPDALRSEPVAVLTASGV
ncbi:hypothetical protein PFZ55_55075, partial [Streptomyces sp. MS2A]|nr:hypothetical protein [Streptomyces sp. MS2A]